VVLWWYFGGTLVVLWWYFGGTLAGIETLCGHHFCCRICCHFGGIEAFAVTFVVAFVVTLAGAS